MKACRLRPPVQAEPRLAAPRAGVVCVSRRVSNPPVVVERGGQSSASATERWVTWYGDHLLVPTFVEALANEMAVTVAAGGWPTERKNGGLKLRRSNTLDAQERSVDFVYSLHYYCCVHFYLQAGRLQRNRDDGWLLLAGIEDRNNVLKRARRSGEVRGLT